MVFSLLSPVLVCCGHKIVLHWYENQNKNNLVIMLRKSWEIFRNQLTISCQIVANISKLYFSLIKLYFHSTEELYLNFRLFSIVRAENSIADFNTASSLKFVHKNSVLHDFEINNLKWNELTFNCACVACPSQVAMAVVGRWTTIALWVFAAWVRTTVMLIGIKRSALHTNPWIRAIPVTFPLHFFNPGFKSMKLT